MSNVDKMELIKQLVKDTTKLEVSIGGPGFSQLTIADQESMVNRLAAGKKRLKIVDNSFNELVLEAKDDSSKLYLMDVINIEQPVFGANNLILSPAGSGKTTFILNGLIENIDQTVLLLVSNTALKDSLVPPNNVAQRIEDGNRMFTTANREVFGDKLYKIHVMTYAEFAKRILANNDFLEGIAKIFCDEIHSLPEYISFGGTIAEALAIARRILFNPIIGIPVFYFTATPDYLEDMERQIPGSMKYVKTFDCLNYPNIKKFTPLVSREFNHIEQTRQYLKDVSASFDYYDYKGFAYCRTITGLKVVEEMVIEEGFNPLVIWSTNSEKYDMTEEQIEARDVLLKTGIIPAPYNFLIFNAALREGWNLKDPKVKIAILDTTNNTEHTQALGRLRRSIDLLVYRTNSPIEDPEILLPEVLLNTPLTAADREELCLKLKIVNEKGITLKWGTVSKIIQANGYTIKESRIRIDGKQVRVETITKGDDSND